MSLWRSSRTLRTPRRARRSAAVTPTGPAPTITTGTRAASSTVMCGSPRGLVRVRDGRALLAEVDAAVGGRDRRRDHVARVQVVRVLGLALEERLPLHGGR